MSESITFKYTLTEDDFVRAIRAFVRSKRLWWIMWAVHLCALAAVYFLLSNVAGLTEVYSLIAVFLMASIYGVVFWWSYIFGPHRFGRSSPFLNVEVEVTASSDGMAWNSPLARGESSWTVYVGALESADHFLLCDGKNLFYIYPKRGFSAPDSVNRLRDLIRENIPNAKLLR